MKDNSKYLLSKKFFGLSHIRLFERIDRENAASEKTIKQKTKVRASETEYVRPHK